MNEANQAYYLNTHSHFKPKIVEEIVIRNAYGVLSGDALQAISYPVSIGFHPWHIQQLSLESCKSYLNQHGSHPNVWAIGETGLDWTRVEPRTLQMNFFNLHFHIACKIGKPLIIHAVKSYYEFIPYLKKTTVPMIFHGFNGNQDTVRAMNSYPAYFSYGKNLFDKHHAGIFSTLPLQKILLETDQSAHIHIADIYRKAAEIRSIPEEEFMGLIKVNGNAVFPDLGLFIQHQ